MLVDGFQNDIKLFTFLLTETYWPFQVLQFYEKSFSIARFKNDTCELKAIL